MRERRERTEGRGQRAGAGGLSTAWKTAAALGMAALAAGAVMGQEPAALALALRAEGRPEAAAVEFRRLALAAEGDAAAGGWEWWAANEYAAAGTWKLSDRMLDRAEDAEPFGLSEAVSWRRAENAMGGGDWASAAFHFDSLRRRVAEDGARGVAARGAAAARLREGQVDAARRALADAPDSAPDAREAIDRHAAGRDKKPWLGGVLGMVPGLGYAYSGEYANAARSIILNGLFIWGMVEAAERDEWGLFAVVAFGEITWYSGSIYGGIDAAHRHNRRRLDEAVAGVRGEPRLRPDPAHFPLVSLRFEF